MASSGMPRKAESTAANPATPQMPSGFSTLRISRDHLLRRCFKGSCQLSVVSCQSPAAAAAAAAKFSFYASAGSGAFVSRFTGAPSYSPAFGERVGMPGCPRPRGVRDLGDFDSAKNGDVAYDLTWEIRSLR